jgi:Ulp1 family protease
MSDVCSMPTPPTTLLYMKISGDSIDVEAIASSTRKLRSSTKTKSADGDLIVIESSEDEGDDMQSLTRSGGTNKKNDAENKLLLEYPFDVDEELLREASQGLLELGGNMLGVKEDEHIVEDQLDEDDVTRVTKKPLRTHHVTIHDEDYERLSPGQFLNDTLVDFWMRW